MRERAVDVEQPAGLVAGARGSPTTRRPGLRPGSPRRRRLSRPRSPAPPARSGSAYR
ncbi:hypothetical protein HBB16_15690 [Pseudonocardia sp. MCCB 268]|nr:hypothetical protein [Pseudonocardia cytotoxica]